MKRVRHKILMIGIMLAVMLGMIGAASAYDCPGPNEWSSVNTPSLQNLYTIAASGTNPMTYSTGGVPSTSTIREVCIASTSSNAQSGTVSWPLWNQGDLTIKPAKPQWARTWAQFKDGGTPNDIPSDGAMHNVGTVTWDNAPGNTQVFILHVADTGCPDKKSCYVIPEGPNPPIPEMGTIVMTATGLLGLVLISRYKKKG